MNYTNNTTGEIVTAFSIDDVIPGDGNYAIKLPEASKIVGLFSTQTESYAPVIGDYYIDAGVIADSLVVPEVDFLNSYTAIE